MPNTIPSANMNMPVPVVGVDPGPDYATDVNQCITILDAHDHSAGYGVQITPAGLNINADLSMQSNDLILIRSTRWDAQGAALSDPSDLGCAYVNGVDLYFNDMNGNQIQITSGGAVAGTPGSISGLVSPASASYVGGSGTFVWKSTATTPANLDCAAITIREQVASPNGITIESPSSLGANYTMVLPTALPAGQRFMTLDNGGNIAASWNVDNSSIEVASNVVRVKAGGITPAMLSTSAFQAQVPPGAILPYGGITPPSGYLLCDGSAVSRTTYSALFAAIGVQWGNGDQSTTFNIPNLQGLFMRGTDNGMGNDPDTVTRSSYSQGGVNTYFATTGAWTNGIDQITSIPDTSSIALGALVQSSYFPANTSVIAILGPTSVQTSQNATFTTSGAISFTISAAQDNVGSYQASEIVSHDHTLTDPGHSHNLAKNATGAGASEAVTPQASTTVTPMNLGTYSATTGITVDLTGGNETRSVNVYVNYIIKT